jgi:hypothetical protein
MSPARVLSCLLVAAGAALAPFGRCAHADVLQSPQGYAVTLPHGWQTRHEVEAHRDGGSTNMMFTHPPGTFPLFRVEVDPQRLATMRNAEAMQAAFIQGKMAGFRVVQQRLRTVAGSPASETAAVGPFGGQRVIVDMIYTIHAHRVYTITLMTTPRTLKADVGMFMRILGTLHWTG